MPSETKPNPENCKNCSSKCAYDCAHKNTVHNTTQNSSDNLCSYLQTNIIAQMLSIGGEGKLVVLALWEVSGIALNKYCCEYGTVNSMFADF